MRVSFYTLGCKVNQYETQSMKEQFLRAGYEVAGDGEGADICVINTCSVTNVADRKSRQYIRRMKHLNPDAVIAVTGCYVQTDPDAVASLDGVNIIAGTNEKGRIVDFVSGYLKEHGTGADRTAAAEKAEAHVLDYSQLTEYEDLGVITAMDSRSRAFIKIEEGCDRFCSYCIIPYARGRVRSRSTRSILEEAEKLIGAGYKEIVLTGINTALYGRDEKGGTSETIGDIADLVRAVSELDGDFRIRLSSLEPNVIDVETALRLTEIDKLCHHMHLSIQSGSDTVLRRMRRRYDVTAYEKIAAALRSCDPDYGITTDIIVGFPGETEREFQETLETADRVAFSKIHVFRYSQRSHTDAAVMPDQIDGKTKSTRAKILGQKSDELAAAFHERNRNKVRRVLFEKITEDGLFIEGYTDNYIRVYVPLDDTAASMLHDFADVLLTDSFRDGMNGILI